MKENLRQLFQQKFDCDEYRKVVLQNLLHAQQLLREPQFLEETNDGDRIYGLGYLHDADGKEIGLYYTDVVNSDVRRKRVGFRQLMKPYVKYGADAAIAIFADREHWRLSYMCDLKGGETSAKRFSYVFGDAQGQYHTPVNRLAQLAMQSVRLRLDDIKEAFSVEALSKEFFDEYHRHYDRICDYIIHSHINTLTHLHIHDYVKKMMGRIVFLHFLQKKGWLNGNLTFLRDLFFFSPHQGDFLEQVLEPLFFGIFNTEKANREQLFKAKGWDMGLLEDWKELPYLNGGLFERDAVDEQNITLPASLFEDLFTFMASYNFTVDENDPDDAEVGVDPEMLGKIFESLLEDNKAKGAFYTPKEIVRYMCKESLIAYLETKVGDDASERHTLNNPTRQCGEIDTIPDGVSETRDLKTSIRTFVECHEMQPVLEPYREALDTALREVKICDPAIGSGAFPMGLLNELWRCREAVEDTISRVDLKKEIIENNIYGVDIEKGAIDIARLRFWLSIVVDAESPEPLPNFDYKFMQGNSLVESFREHDLSHIMDNETVSNKRTTYQRRIDGKEIVQVSMDFSSEDTRRNLRIWLKKYFSLSNHHEKTEYRQRINESVKSYIRQQGVGTITEDSLNTLDPSANQDFFLWHTWFKDIFNKGGFDIVIGNPPYVSVQLMTDDEKNYYRSHYDVFYKRCDLFALFVERGISHISANNGVVTFIIPSVVHSNMSYTKLRDLILNNHWLKEVCYTGGDVFNAPTVDTTILICNKNGNQDITLKNAVDFANPLVKIVPADYFAMFNNVISVVGSADADSVFSKVLNEQFEQVDEHYTVYQGIVTGNNPAFIFENESDALSKGIEKELLHPLCHGRDIEKYMVRSHDRRIMYIDGGVDIEKYPKTKEWLLNFKDRLETRREVRRNVIKWYGLQWPRIKTELDLKEKILLQNTRNESLKIRIAATLDDTGIYGTQGLNFIIPKDNEANLHYVLGILNSKLINYLFATKFLNLAIKAEYVKQIRIPSASPVQKQTIIDLVDEILVAKKDNPAADITEIEREIDKQVYTLYNLTPEEIAIIEEP